MQEIDRIVRFRGRWHPLCNFYPAAVRWEGIKYPTSEHAYNAAKTIDPLWRRRIAIAPTPGLAKKLGRAAPLRPGWEVSERYWAMTEILDIKFEHPRLRDVLLSTGDAFLVEGNTWHDQHWGNCICRRREKCARQGDNHLGRLLMDLRDQLRGRA